MKLFVETQKEQGSATVPVRWCINQTEKQWFLEQNIDPAFAFVLMSVVNDGQEIDRFAVPLDQMMMYVPFRKPGKNAVKTIIIYATPHTVARRLLRGRLLERNKLDFENRILTYDNVAFDEERIHSRYDAKIVTGSAAEAEVMVDQRFFVKRPFDWPWVNFLFETKPVDQCQFRRRRFIAYTAQPVLFLLWYAGVGLWYAVISPLVKLATVIGLLLWGIKPNAIGWKAFLPWKPIPELVENVHLADNNYTRYINRRGRWVHPDPRPWWRFFLKPLFLLLFATALLFIPGFGKITLFAAIATIVLIIAFGAIWTLFVKLPRWLKGDKEAYNARLQKRQLAWEAKRETARKLRKQLQQQSLARSLAPLACDSDLSFEPTLAALPPEKRTFHLRFWDLKAKVCRPFSG